MTGCSVVIPAYHSEPTIARAVRSALAQTRPPEEILLIADDEIDYRPVLQQAGLDHPAVRYGRTGVEGGGPALGRNLGLDRAAHDLIAFLDADDMFAPARLERLLPLAARHGAALSAIEVRDHATNALETNINFAMSQTALGPAQLSVVGLHTMAHFVIDRRQCNLRFELISPLEDIVFGFHLYDQLQTVGYDPDPLFVYYQREGSICNSPENAQRFLTVIDELLQPSHRVASYKAYADLRQHLLCIKAAEELWIQDETIPFKRLHAQIAERMLGVEA